MGKPGQWCTDWQRLARRGGQRSNIHHRKCCLQIATTVTSGNNDGKVRLWDVETGQMDKAH
ncbi:hypothetical protein BDR06DRAFT_871976 [Suillus hirtellus]|nr:hypothetical protein BDR06DRAFT_871976 [Suillus hirtellus]